MKLRNFRGWAQAGIIGIILLLLGVLPGYLPWQATLSVFALFVAVLLVLKLIDNIATRLHRQETSDQVIESACHDHGLVGDWVRTPHLPQRIQRSSGVFEIWMVVARDHSRFLVIPLSDGEWMYELATDDTWGQPFKVLTTTDLTAWGNCPTQLPDYPADEQTG